MFIPPTSVLIFLTEFCQEKTFSSSSPRRPPKRLMEVGLTSYSPHTALLFIRCGDTISLNCGHRWSVSMESHGGMIRTGKTRRTRGETCPNATLSTKNPTLTNSEANPGPRGQRPSTNRLSYGTAQTQPYLRLSFLHQTERNNLWNHGYDFRFLTVYYKVILSNQSLRAA
jgi:hypothetical protein